MFVEGEVEIKVRDHSTRDFDEHDFKLWLQRAFKDMTCYRVSQFRRGVDNTVRAVVALKITDLPEAQRRTIEARPHDVVLLRDFVEGMFAGKGTCRCLGEPKLQPN